MKKRVSLSRVLINLFLATLVAFAIAPLTAGASPSVAAGIFACTTIPQLFGINIMPIGALQIGVSTEIWTQDIADTIQPKNEFYTHGVDDSQYVNNKTVHLPQSGSDPNVEMNRATFPATVSQRVDTELDYSIDEFSTDPIMVAYSEELEASYNMRASILQQHIGTLKTKIADRFAFLWAPSAAASILRTTGTGRAAYKAGQSGNRKALVYADFVNAMTLLDSMDVPSQGRVALIDSALMADLFKIDEFIDASKFGQTGALPNGAIGMVLGISIYTRSRVQSYDNESTPVKLPFGSANAATSNVAALFWHPNFVRKAIGNTDNGGIVVSINEGRADFNGATLISALVRAGGRIARADAKGVVALVEAAA